MCMMIYIASDHPLPLVAWDEARPGFHVVELRTRDEPVRRQFSMRCVYYVGSHEGCGCGFQYGQHEGLEEDPERLAAARDARRWFSEYLDAVLRDRPEVRLFACWDGDQGAEPEHRGRMQPADLLGDRVHFREKELPVVVAGPVKSRATAGPDPARWPLCPRRCRGVWGPLIVGVGRLQMAVFDELFAIGWPNEFEVEYADCRRERLLRGEGVALVPPDDDPEGIGFLSADLPLKHPRNQKRGGRVVRFNKLRGICGLDGQRIWPTP